MKALLLFVLGTVLLTLQTTLQDVVSVFGVVPDFMLVFLVAVALKFGPVAGVWTGFAIGAAQGAWASSLFGVDAMALCLVGYAAGLAEEQVLKLDLVTKILLLTVAYFLRFALYCFLGGMDGAALFGLLLSGGFAQGLFTVVLGSVWFAVFTRDRQV